MNSFREKTPTRRNDVAFKKNYQEYNSLLKEDFNKRCGYCDDHLGWRNSFYEIDHFIPKFFLEESEYSNYDNLVLACRFCNNSKRSKWPSKDRARPNDGKIGFVDPCNEEYDSHFKRNSEGEILHQSDLGLWMYKELKLYLKRHSILWQVEKIDKVLKEFKELRLHEKDTHKDLIIKMQYYFQDYIDMLREENAK